MKTTSRREALCRIGALVPAFAAEARPKARKPVMAAHAWVYAARQPGFDFTPVLEQIFADLSYAGFDAVELMERALRHEDAVDRIGSLSQKYKLPVIGTSYDAPMWNRAEHARILKDAEVVIGRLAKLGGRVLGTSVGDARRLKTEAELDAQADILKKLIGICDANGVVLNLHNHIYEVANNEHDLRGTLARIPGAKLGPDLDWLVGAGVDPVDFLRRYGRRIVYMHLRDRKADRVWPEAVGEGATDFAAIGRELRRQDYSGDMAIELAHPPGFKLTRPLRESWKMSRDYVRRVMGY
jgi:sugar phosphate isomerase/epimerase